jgi:type II secretory ATPase GspE/PulE/Tfp pilus assembly ATPase PilB-like protein
MGVDALETFRETLARRAGVTVVCGPDASGTTTTLYAALDVLNTPDRVVATIEAPVDRLVEGIDQMEVDAQKSMTFSRGLETLLAIDSDVVLVGELSDRETAELAFGAARAGRQILGGLGVPSSARAIRHLTKLGIDSKVLAETLACVVAHRLVRLVCGECRETYYASESELAELGQPVEGGGPRLLARGRGCEACDGAGYRDRVGLFEVLLVGDEIRRLIETRASSKEIHDAAIACGMRTLRDDGIRLCLEGVTTFAEVERVLGAED